MHCHVGLHVLPGGESRSLGSHLPLFSLVHFVLLQVPGPRRARAAPAGRQRGSGRRVARGDRHRWYFSISVHAPAILAACACRCLRRSCCEEILLPVFACIRFPSWPANGLPMSSFAAASSTRWSPAFSRLLFFRIASAQGRALRSGRWHRRFAAGVALAAGSGTLWLSCCSLCFVHPCCRCLLLTLA